MKIFAIDVRDVSFTYEVHCPRGERTWAALDGVSLAVRMGQAHGLIGPSGAGKSTLIGLIVGTLAMPAAARERVRVFGLPAGSHDLRAHIGHVPQTNALFPELSARENLVHYARMQGLSESASRARTGETLARLNLEEAAESACGQLSEGVKRRLSLGTALLHEPRLLALDEPTAGVDPQSREEILTLLRELQEEGTTLLFATPHLAESARLCDEVTVLDAGRRVSTVRVTPDLQSPEH